MGIITSIEKQKNNPNRVNIFIDHQFSFSCHIEIVVTFKMVVGSSMPPEDIQEIIMKDNIKRGFDRSLSYLSYQARSKKEIWDFLEKQGYDEAVVEAVINKLKYYGYINDHEYAKNFTHRSIQQNKGSHRIQMDLGKKGIDDEIIQEAFSSFSEKDEVERAFQYAKQFSLKNPKLSFQQVQNKLSTKLSTKGYGWEVIKSVLVLLEKDEEIQELMDSNEEEHIQTAFQLAEKYYKKYNVKNISTYQLKNKIILALKRKGYVDHILMKAIEKLF